MNTATYTKIAKSSIYNDTSMSLGFRRFLCLPKQVKLNIGIAYYLATGLVNDHDHNVAFFGAMTEAEYQQYIIAH
jgi:hypothetical protein